MSGNDLIIEKGFAVLNNFKPGAADENQTDPLPRSNFASYSNAITLSDTGTILQDCSLVFTARTKEDSDGYSAGSTFFLPCQMKPRCALEALAQQIFNAHVDGCDDISNGDGEKKKLLYDPERSGAEWWTLVLDTPSSGGVATAAKKDTSSNDDDGDDDDDEEDDEVGMHFDADYGLEGKWCILNQAEIPRYTADTIETLFKHITEQLPTHTLHPRVATVTYFSDIGVPTLILDKRPPLPNDPEKQSLNGSINKAWLSHPRMGKHIAFDGRLLHGAPGEYLPSTLAANTTSRQDDEYEPKAKKLKLADDNTIAMNGKRITLLVNIWLNHCPLESEPLDDELVDKMTTPWKDDTQKEEDTTCTKKGNLKGDPIEPPFKWNVKDINAPDKLSNVVSLSKVVSESNKVPAESVICNRHVDIFFGATMEDFHNASKLAANAEGGSLPIDMEDGVLTLKVGKELSSDDEQEE